MLDSISVMEICQKFAREMCTIPGILLIQAVVCTIHYMLTVHNGAYIATHAVVTNGSYYSPVYTCVKVVYTVLIYLYCMMQC